MSGIDLPDDATVTLTVRQLKEMLGTGGAAADIDQRAGVPMTVNQVAKALDGKSASTMRSWLSSGRLAGFKLGNAWMVRPEALDEFFARAEEGHEQQDEEGDPDSVDLGSWRKGRAS